jgi:hypothetical protein
VELRNNRGDYFEKLISSLADVQGIDTKKRKDKITFADI